MRLKRHSSDLSAKGWQVTQKLFLCICYTGSEDLKVEYSLVPTLFILNNSKIVIWSLWQTTNRYEKIQVQYLGRPYNNVNCL